MKVKTGGDSKASFILPPLEFGCVALTEQSKRLINARLVVRLHPQPDHFHLSFEICHLVIFKRRMNLPGHGLHVQLNGK